MSRTFKALVVAPDGTATLGQYRADSAEDIRRAIGGGYLEGLSLADGAFAYFDEEGVLKRLPVNSAAALTVKRFGRGLHRLCGPVLFCGSRGESEVDVPDALVEYVREYLCVEITESES